MNLRRLAAATAVLSLVLVACGQFKGVHERAVQLVPGANGGVVGGGAGTVPGESGPVPGEAGTIPGEAGTVPGGTTGGTVPTGTTGGTTGGIAGGTTGAGTQVRGGDTTGVTPTTIKIAIHAPLTGAAPLKASSFDAGKDLY